jgi:pimeloyl-ACP methyl ester carboxylesterase
MERGHGMPLVLVPGLQGRWEYVAPAADALAESCRVLTFSLCGEPRANPIVDGPAALSAETDQIRQLLDERRIERAAICGISFGGLIALRFAATHPDRTSALVLASAPGPDFHLLRRHELYTRAPRIFGPFFLAETPRRLRREIKATFPNRLERLRFLKWQLKTLIAAPVSVTRMAKRAHMISNGSAAADARMVSAPTLIVTGEPSLDRVVAASGSVKYAELIARSTRVVIDHTGHLGSITRPRAFAAAVTEFLN